MKKIFQKKYNTDFLVKSILSIKIKFDYKNKTTNYFINS